MKQYKPRDKVTQKITREGAVRRTNHGGAKMSLAKKSQFFRAALALPRKIVPCRNWNAISAKRNGGQGAKAEAARERIPKEEKADP